MSRAAALPGTAGLDRDCTINVSQLLTVDRTDLEEPLGVLDSRTIRRVDDGLRLVLSLG